jgi:starch-binding outer membrane protein, SusD/RagB family
MNTKKLMLYLWMLPIALLFSQCNKLEEKVYSQTTESVFFGSQKDVTAALTGMYRSRQSCGTCGGYGQAGTMVLNGTSDEGNGAAQWGDYPKLVFNSSKDEIRDWWNASYSAIAGANLITDNEAKILAIDNSAAGQAFAKAAIGEAKFWRALNYFELVQMYGGVPLRTTQAKRADQVNLPRNTVDEVYTQVIKDFKDAEVNLPATAPKGIVKKWAASAYLAKVYLTKKDYPNALAKATEVISSGVYTLATTFADVFDVTKENGPEDIFAIQYVEVDEQGTRLGSLSGWGITSVDPSLYPKFAATDKRRAVTFAEPANPASNQGKWLFPGVVGNKQPNNFIVFRYADLVLIKAEAENEISGATAAAYTEINKVRTRAGLPALTAGLTKVQFRDAVLNERNLELALEQIRWFDLKRTDRLKSSLIAVGRPWNDKYLLFPIPQSEIDASNGVVKQNDGY